MTAVCMTQRRLEWNRYCRRSDIDDLHLVRNMDHSRHRLIIGHISFDIYHLVFGLRPSPSPSPSPKTEGRLGGNDK
jgi:hypothetical protein